MNSKWLFYIFISFTLLDLIAHFITNTTAIRLNYGWYNSRKRRPVFTYHHPPSDFPPINYHQRRSPPPPPIFSSSYKRSVHHHHRPFRPSPLIHQSSYQHFTEPLSHLPESHSSEEEQYQYSRPIPPGENYIIQSHNSVHHSRPVTIASSSGADFPELNKFEHETTSYNFEDSLKTVPNAVTQEFKKPDFENVRVTRNFQPNFQGSSKEHDDGFTHKTHHHFQPFKETNVEYGHIVHENSGGHPSFGNAIGETGGVIKHEQDLSNVEDIDPDNFGPRPVDFEMVSDVYEPESAHEFPAAPPSHSVHSTFDRPTVDSDDEFRDVIHSTTFVKKQKPFEDVEIHAIPPRQQTAFVKPSFGSEEFNPTFPKFTFESEDFNSFHPIQKPFQKPNFESDNYSSHPVVDPPEHSSNKFLSSPPEEIYRPTRDSDGCHVDGNFYSGGQTWSLSDCGRGVCAKALKGGWEATFEKCDSILQNPQYSCVFDESFRSDFPDCCPKPIQCNN